MKSIVIASFLSLAITLGGYIGVVKFSAQRSSATSEEAEPLTRSQLAAAELQLQGFEEQKDAFVAIKGSMELIHSNISIAKNVLLEEQKKLEQMHVALQEEKVVVKQQSDKSLTKVAKLYESMKPDQAAQIASQLHTDLLVEIIPRMKERAAGKLLSAMDSKRAAEISRRLAE